MEKKQQNIAILFGAGAEADYGQPVGEKFAEKILTSNYKKQRKKLLSQTDFKYCQLINPNSTKVFIQTIVQNEKKALEYGFDEKTITMIKNYYQGDDKPDYSEVREKCHEWYKEITDPHSVDETEKRMQEKHKQFFLKYAVFFDALDSKFNSLRKSENDNISRRVINTYLIIFLFMMENNYDLGISETSELTYEEIMNAFEGNDLRKELKSQQENTYYSVLKKYRNLIEQNKLHIITTNYTDIVEQVVGDSFPKLPIVHLHGKLCLFEDRKKLTIYDCSNEKERELALKNKEDIFPYILIPSGVKPIICKKQIEDFYRFNRMLEDSELLIVVGYQFNLEDNHINSMIADWLREANGQLQRRLIYFNYNGGMQWDKHSWFKDFRMNCETNNNKDDIDLIDENKCICEKELKQLIYENLKSTETNGKIISFKITNNKEELRDSNKLFDLVLKCCEEEE